MENKSKSSASEEISSRPDSFGPEVTPCGAECENVYWKLVEAEDLQILSGTKVALYLRERTLSAPIAVDHFNVRQTIQVEYGDTKPETRKEFDQNGVPRELLDKLRREYQLSTGKLIGGSVCADFCECFEIDPTDATVARGLEASIESTLEYDETVSTGTYRPRPGERQDVAPPVDRIRQANGQAVEFDPDTDILDLMYTTRFGVQNWRVVRRYIAIVRVSIKYDEIRVNGWCVDSELLSADGSRI